MNEHLASITWAQGRCLHGGNRTTSPAREIQGQGAGSLVGSALCPLVQPHLNCSQMQVSEVWGRCAHGRTQRLGRGS